MRYTGGAWNEACLPGTQLARWGQGWSIPKLTSASGGGFGMTEARSGASTQVERIAVRYWAGLRRKSDTKEANRTFAAVVHLSLLGIALALVLAGCDSGSSPTSTSGDVQLSQVPWCDAPLISFQDDSTTTQKIITDWSAVKDQLGFTPYLPSTMPKGTCRALAGSS